jgi:proteic killer suppression protein
MLNAARQLNDLRAPPANRLEALTGSRRGQYSIRINDQWRICFTWTKEGPARCRNRRLPLGPLRPPIG